MTSRERVLAALDHRPPDRTPLDLGGSIVTGIHCEPLQGVRRELGLEERPARIYDTVQMLGEVEMDLVERLGIDVLRVDLPGARVGAHGAEMKLWEPFEGVTVEVPASLDVGRDGEGGWYLFRGAGDDRKPVMHMPEGSFYFDTIGYGRWHHDFKPPPLEEIRRASESWHLHEPSLEILAARAQELRETTDRALLMMAGGVGVCYIGHLTDFLCLLAEDPDYVYDSFQINAEVAISNLEKMWEYVGDNVDLLWISGLDLGSQRCELISPATFERVYVPAFRPQYEWIHENTTWRTFRHSCGSIANIVETMADAGVDALNPVQTTAAGMEPSSLKERVGDKVAFWGGGVETQGVLQFGTPDQVREQVAERVRIFGEGGGFVFCPDHNIQPNTPPENIIAAYETAREADQHRVSQHHT